MVRYSNMQNDTFFFGIVWYIQKNNVILHLDSRVFAKGAGPLPLNV